jgi:SAM-dependent methyltransferase
MAEKIRLNLGCGQEPLKGYLNVDLIDWFGVDKVVDLTRFPWPWPSESVDEIRMWHVLEHLEDQQRILGECWRVLRKGGILNLSVPHVSNMRANGDLGHFRGYSVKTFDHYLCTPYYWYGDPIFKTVSKKITYLGYGKSWWLNTLYFLTLPIEWAINICPELFERVTWVYLGGATSVEWKGERL